MQLFYNSNLNHDITQFSFSSEESRHIVKVLRKKEGDILHITNGLGDIFRAQIQSSDVRDCKAKILSHTKKDRDIYGLHMAVAPTKNNDRFEWFLEKATEIGVTQITPIICERSQRKSIKRERMERIVLSAMKQSLRAHLPKLNAAISYEDFLKISHDGFCCIAHCEKGKKKELGKKMLSAKDITILIGPEGDFTPLEIKQALDQGFNPISLGTHRLRTETAAIVACSIVANTFTEQQ